MQVSSMRCSLCRGGRHKMQVLPCRKEKHDRKVSEVFEYGVFRMRRTAPLLFLLLSLLPLSGAWASCFVVSKSTTFSASYKYPAGSCDYSEREGVMVNNCSSLEETVACLCSHNPKFCTLDDVNRQYKQSLGYGFPELNQNPLTYLGLCPERAAYPHMNHFYEYCDTQTELDSAVCVNGGNEWNGTSCSSGDSTGYACQTFRKRTEDGRSYMAHIVYKLNYTNKTSEIIEEMSGTCYDMGYCKSLNEICEDTEGAMEEHFGDSGESSSSSSAFDFDRSSSSVSCKQTGQFFNTCYYECSNGAVGACYGKDGKCDEVSDCTWEDVVSSSSGSGGGSSSGSGGGGSSSSGTGGDTTVVGGIDYTAKLNEIIDTLHNGNNATRGTNAQLAQISNQLENLNINVAVGGSGGLTKGQYDAGVAKIVEAQNGTQVKLDALGNVIETKFASSDSLMANGWRSLDYWRETDSIQYVKQNESDSIRNRYVMRIDSVLTDTAIQIGDTSLVEVDFDSIEVWRPDTANAYLPDINEDSIRNDFLSKLDTSLLADSATLAELDNELNFDVDSLHSALKTKNDSLKNDSYDLVDSAYGVWEKAVYNPFDSLLERVLPKDSDHCPEECYKFDLAIPFGFGEVKADADFSKWLCSNSALTWSGGMGVLGLIRILLRLISAFSAVWIVFRFFGMKL